MEKISVGKIDSNGFLIDVYLGTKTDDGQVEIDGIILDKTEYVENIGGAVSKVRAKWTGYEWVEGATQKEIEEYEANLEKELYPNGRPEPLPPQKTMAELEVELLDTQSMAIDLMEQNEELKAKVKDMENSSLDLHEMVMNLYETAEERK